MKAKKPPRPKDRFIRSTAVRAAALDACDALFGFEKVRRIDRSLFLDCEIAVEKAIRRAIEHHQRTKKTLEGIGK